ncbi:multidrug transport protein [Paucilactobacillus oligofermentans DSM 15707 = LMG 22743]|uniref:Multidrug transport protein n=1 Tax=Paucilactobacillus oligofermentans DSM 15707 = LMG 22743 TaxID=1423778 RepID=A0A0R1RGQ6_9LACO|nr:MFS transporter [Paucilactobacillus oligofermentans]KRL55561.1 multidrug transport protein [Paucilactobacillus oligofermentans DSM 15707 = LMG 22743]CUS25451.1 Multidrug resistance protein [Paucilactobacillus oligofermentans DSM 15707 = LMG 22743]
MKKQTKRAILVLLVSEFLVCLGISLVIPVMPFLKTSLHLTAFDMGVMTSLFALVQFVASPIVGRISDRIGRKKILVIGSLLYMLSEILFAVTNNLLMFDISRAVGGLSAAMYVPTSMALAADITTKRERAKVIGWLSAAFSAGLILGPGIGGILANISLKTPFWLSALLGLLGTLSLWAFLPSDKSMAMHEDDAPEEKHKSVNVFLKTMTVPMLVLFAMILVSAFGLQGFESIYSLYVNEVFKFTMSNIALVLTLNGIISIIIQVLFFDRLVVWFKEARIIRACFFFSIIGIAWIILAHSKWEVVIATLIVFTAYDILRPSITTLLTKMSTSDQGLINGMNMSLTSVGNVIGPLVSGALLDMNYHLPYLVVIVFMIMSFVIAFFIKNVNSGEVKVN